MTTTDGNGGKRAVLMVCDGLRADMISPEHAPNLARLRDQWCAFADHSGVFPSTTRVTSASIATGCLPARHGLLGNTMALDEGEGLVCRNAGMPDFRERMRRATGATLRVPTLAERLRGKGGSIVFSNVSPGAAYFQDPDGFGYVYHSSGAFGPGPKLLPENEWLQLDKGVPGDTALTARFCEEVLRIRRPTLAVIWLSEPDFSGHNAPLGSPAHLAGIAGADACAAKVIETVEALDPEWRDYLMILCSDHGHETGLGEIRVGDLLVEAGLKDAPDSTEVVVAPNGTAALIYLSEAARDSVDEIAGFLRGQEWVERLYVGPELEEVGLPSDTALAIAIDMGKTEKANGHGVAGHAYTVHDPLGGKDYTGLGQHGGLGANEQKPFLLAHGGEFPVRTRIAAPSSPTDIAPTILAHLGMLSDGMDGKPLTAR